ncbi:hypothetical protein V2K64_07790 [Pseudomonas alliivorans]|nr:hypothetical protein [Pseudomonas alliivorans]
MSQLTATAVFYANQNITHFKKITVFRISDMTQVFLIVLRSSVKKMTYPKEINWSEAASLVDMKIWNMIADINSIVHMLNQLDKIFCTARKILADATNAEKENQAQNIVSLPERLIRLEVMKLNQAMDDLKKKIKKIITASLNTVSNYLSEIAGADKDHLNPSQKIESNKNARKILKAVLTMELLACEIFDTETSLNRLLQ